MAQLRPRPHPDQRAKRTECQKGKEVSEKKANDGDDGDDGNGGGGRVHAEVVRHGGGLPVADVEL